MRIAGKLIALAAALVCAASAQTLTQARTDVYYDSVGNNVYQVTTATVDYNTQYYYDLQVTSYLRKNGFTASFAFGDSSGGNTATSYASTPSEDGSFFDVYSYFNLNTYYQTYEVDGSCYNCYDWYDAYDYSFVSQTGDSSDSGPTYSVWIWAPPVLVARVVTSSIQLGSTGAAAQLPGTRSIFDVKLRAFIPPKWVTGPDTCIDSRGNIKSTIYHGDGRGFNPYTWDVRAHTEVLLNVPAGVEAPNSEYNYTGYSIRYASDALAADGVSLIGDSVLHDCYRTDNTGFASIANMHIAVSGSPGNLSANFYGGAADPVASVPAPETNWNVTVSIATANPAFPSYTAQWTHDCYPAFELYIGSQRIYGFMPPGNNPFIDIGPCLLGFGQISGQTIGTVL